MFDIKTSQTIGDVIIPATPGFFTMNFWFRDDQKVSRDNVGNGIVARHVVAWSVRNGEVSPITFPATEVGDASAIMLPSSVIVEGEVTHKNFETFLVSLLERWMRMRPVKPAVSGVDVRLVMPS